MQLIQPRAARSNPLVSVIMCVRDGEEYIGEALDSIAAQSIAALETLVILDGSSDRSETVARGHPISPTIISRPALGLPAAMNCGMEQAKGDFITFLDCDDVWPDRRLEIMLAAFERNPEVDGVFSVMINTNHRLVPMQTFEPARMMNAMLVKRASARRVGALRTDVRHAANIDWISRATVQGLAFLPLDTTAVLRRVHGENMGLRDRSRARRDLLRVVRDHHRRKRQ